MGVFFISAIAIVSRTVASASNMVLPGTPQNWLFLDVRLLVVAGGLPVSLLGFYSPHLVA